jgi:radical SAM family uncharacterized protein
VYEVAMSHTGLAIIYDILNGTEHVVAERVFAPWIDAEQIMRTRQIPLFSLESKASLKSFDIIGFALTNELCYTNVLNMLDLGGLEVRSAQRRPDDPLVIAGGGMANCCEPVADFFDAFILGDGEDAAPAFVQHVRFCYQAGLPKEHTLISAARMFEWLYVPALYQPQYRGGTLVSIQALMEDVPVRRENAVVGDFENALVPTRPIVPFVQAVHERVSIEIMRGCPGRCRFCQVSFCKRPIRSRSIDRIVTLADQCVKTTGFDTVGLLSLSSAEYPDLKALIERLHVTFAHRHVGLSVPSLRVDRQLSLLPTLLVHVRKSGLTMAVEAASERLRRIINKPISDEDLLAAVQEAYRAGWHRIKLYFIVGLPGETQEDIRRIVYLAYQIAELKKMVNGRSVRIHVAISWFVPKPHTPFAWFGQRSRDYFQQARDIILDEKRRLHARDCQFKFHHMDRSIIESSIGRGDRRFAEVIERAWRFGARFDLWDECFDADHWHKAFAAVGVDGLAAGARTFDLDQCLPWDHLGGPDKQQLISHFEKACEEIEVL